MAVELFQNREADYLNWIGQHSDGYVLNTRRERPANYMVLHRADCRTISIYKKRGAFTERKYIKVCARTTSELIIWIQDNGGHGFTILCKKCNPIVSADGDGILRELETYLAVLDDEVSKSMQDRDARRKRLENAPVLPSKVTMSVQFFIRNADVIAEVLQRANGRCESCKAKAPFLRAKDRTPYLEVHHKRPLSQQGEDTVENAIALCPNCHREAHFGTAMV